MAPKMLKQRTTPKESKEEKLKRIEATQKAREQAQKVILPALGIAFLVFAALWFVLFGFGQKVVKTVETDK